MSYTFKIKENEGQYRAFFCYNWEELWWTDGYSSKAGAENAISIIKLNSPGAPIQLMGKKIILTDEYRAGLKDAANLASRLAACAKCGKLTYDCRCSRNEYSFWIEPTKTQIVKAILDLSEQK